MKRISIAFLLCFALLYPYSSFAQTTDSITELAEPTPAGTRPIMDALSLLVGVYSPLDEEMKGIYGSMFSWSVQYNLNMGGQTDILASVGLMRDSGNPYYDVPTFSSGKSSTIQLIPMELSIKRRMVFLKDTSGLASRGLYMGAGINYIRASEKISEFLSASGGNFGLQIFAGPRINLTENFVFDGEVKFLMNAVDMRHEGDRYTVNLSGLVIRAALSWYY